MGRMDAQLKIRGFRVEPEEVESVLADHPEVEVAVVDAREVAPGNRILVVYVVPAAGARPDTESLLSYAHERLPAHLVPTVVASIDKVPRTVHGKINRSALPDPAPVTTAALDGDVGAPLEDELTARMVNLWAAVLRCSGIGTNVDFFALGGHSLLATQLVSRIRDEFGVEIPISAVFEHPTPSGLVVQVRHHLATGTGAPSELEPAPLTGDLPLSYAQQRLWFLAELHPDLRQYNVPIAMDVVGDLRVDVLRRAVDRLTARHAGLRSNVIVVHGHPVQRVRSKEAAPVDVTDYLDLPPQEAERRAQADLQGEADRSFDLSRDPLFRVHVWRTAERSAMLLLNLHHIVFDRWSRENLCADLAELYCAEIDGTPPDLPELRYSYVDFARWQHRWLETPAASKQMDYWLEHLRNLPPPLELAAQKTRPEDRSYAGDVVTFQIPAYKTERVRAFAAATDSTPFMVLLASYQATLRLAGAGTDFVVGVPVANRLRAEFEPLIGFFVNSLPIRADLTGRPTFRELVSRVRHAAVSAYANQHIPFDLIVEKLQPPRYVNRDPVFDVMFTYQNVPAVTTFQLPGVQLTPLPSNAWIAKRDLTLHMEETPELHGDLEFDTELFDRETAERFVSDYGRILEAALDDPDTDITRLGHRAAMSNEQRRAAGRAAFTRAIGTAPEKVRLDCVDTVHRKFLPGNDNALPVVLHPERNGVDLAAWGGDNAEEIRKLVSQYGGVLLRGFRVLDGHGDTVNGFERFAASQIGELMEYQERSTPRSHAGGGHVYTSTEYPAEEYIELHNEMSYSHVWPMMIAFFCQQAAIEGGGTPIADSRVVYRAIPEDIRRPFEERGVMYVRNYGEGLDLSWQEAFQTSNRAAVEQHCREADVEMEWGDGDRLRTRQIRPAVAPHPDSGDPVWFNSVHMFHVAAHSAAVRESLRTVFREEELPRHAYYGDGKTIPDEVVAEIRALHRRLTVRFDWRNGDVMLLDNMLVCHGREPFRGDRRVLVAFGNPGGPTVAASRA